MVRSTFELLNSPLSRKVSDENLSEIDRLVDYIDEEKLDTIVNKSKSSVDDKELFQTLLSYFGEQ